MTEFQPCIHFDGMCCMNAECEYYGSYSEYCDDECPNYKTIEE